MKYTLTDNSERKSYFFTHNSFGDIIGIYSGSGVLTAQYEYDAWGNVISITDGNGNEITDTNNIGLLNPFRYRGYYYDSETGLYYLMSRYYDPVTRRFINADGYFQSGGNILDTNMSAYCRNNPITFVDPTGSCYWAAGKWTHDAWENLGGYVKQPEPKAIDITEQLDEAMKENAKEIATTQIVFGYPPSTAYFAFNVAPHGDWDFKSQDSWNLDPNKTYRYKNLILRFDDIGNIHYGYIGRFMFSEDVLLKAAGVVQICTKTSDITYWDSNFDEPRDQTMIKIGSDLFEQKILIHSH